MTAQPATPNPQQENPDEEKPSPFLTLSWNTTVLAGLTWLFWYKNALWETCVVPFWGALSQTVLIFFGFQLFWMIFREPAHKGVKKLGEKKIEGSLLGLKFEISPELVFAIFDTFNLRFLPRYLQIGLSLSFVLLSSLILWGSKLGLSPYSPFTIAEFVPVIQNYAVSFPGEETPHTIRPPDSLQIASNQTVQITANISPTSDVFCEWARKGGIPFSGNDCTVQYTPHTREPDILTLTVESACKTKTTVSSLFITIILP